MRESHRHVHELIYNCIFKVLHKLLAKQFPSEMANETLFPALILWVQECLLKYTYEVGEYITVMTYWFGISRERKCFK